MYCCQLLVCRDLYEKDTCKYVVFSKQNLREVYWPNSCPRTLLYTHLHLNLVHTLFTKC